MLRNRFLCTEVMGSLSLNLQTSLVCNKLSVFHSRIDLKTINVVTFHGKAYTNGFYVFEYVDACHEKWPSCGVCLEKTIKVLKRYIIATSHTHYITLNHIDHVQTQSPSTTVASCYVDEA